jgi:hypothetical protein
MPSKKEISNAVDTVRKALQDTHLTVYLMEHLLRLPEAGENELQENPELLEDAAQISEDDPGFALDEECCEPNSAYIQGGAVILVYNGVKYGIPVEDIAEIKVSEIQVTFVLAEALLDICWE